MPYALHNRRRGGRRINDVSPAAAAVEREIVTHSSICNQRDALLTALETLAGEASTAAVNRALAALRSSERTSDPERADRAADALVMAACYPGR